MAKDLSIAAETEAEVKTNLVKTDLAKAKAALIEAKDVEKAEAVVAKAKADLVLVETEVALVKAKATEAEAIADLTKAKSTLIEVDTDHLGLVDRVEKDLTKEKTTKTTVQTEVALAEASVIDAEEARTKAEKDLADAKVVLARVKALIDNLNQRKRTPRVPPTPR